MVFQNSNQNTGAEKAIRQMWSMEISWWKVRKSDFQKLKWIAMKKHREPAEGLRLKSVTVSMEPSGKYFASLLYEGYSCENQAAEPDYSTAKILGIDYAMQGMAVFSEKIEMEEAGFFLPVKNAVNVEG